MKNNMLEKPGLKTEVLDKGSTYVVKLERTIRVPETEHQIRISWGTIITVAILIVCLIIGISGYSTATNDNNDTYHEIQHTETIAITSVYELKSIFENSSFVLLAESDVIELASRTGCAERDVIQAAINELYARNHYLFEESKIRTYFEDKEWYIGYRSAEEALANFNEIEGENFRFLCELRGKYK